MGIMNKMRQKMGIVLIILIAAFVITIVFNWGAGGIETFTGGRDVVGLVNGEKITIKEFYETYNMALDQYRDAGIELNAQTRETVLQQTWETVVSQVLWEQEIDRLNIAVSDEELFYHLENNPPEFLKQQEVFLTDGQFDKQKYLDVLYNPQGGEWLQIENYLRHEVLPYQKLNDIVMSSVVIDENEISEAYIAQHVDFAVNYVGAPLRSLPDSIFSVYEEDLQEYYDEHKEELYKQPEKRYIRVVSWPKVPSSQDSADVRRTLEDIRIRHEEGESFDDLAQVFSEMQDENMIGDLGWFTAEELRPEYREAVMAAESGAVLDPIIIDDEYHLIKVTEKRQQNGDTEVRISLIVRRLNPVNTYDYFASEADAFLLDVESYGFEKAFENVDAKLDTFKGGFTKEFPYVGNLGYFPDLVKWVYRSEKSELSPVYENENAYAVAQIYKIVEASHTPFEDVRASVKRDVIRQLKSERSSRLVREAYDAVTRGDVSPEGAAEQSPYLEYNDLTFTLNKLPYPFSSSEAFSDVVRNMTQNTLSPPFNAGQYGSLFLRLTHRGNVDEELFAQERSAIRQSLLQEKRDRAYESWLEHLKENADIRDYREKFGLN
ncbi:MAG: SurA N-terminal domain-containing protein [Candidatus Marinimicrobia bacterium]|nr:SurA N-terminal domain-containing protein [Candidatus Neomarinimicrobiota bacterium]